MSTQQQLVPNHHANYPGLAGITGLLVAASMAVGREGDARLAAELSGLHPGDRIVDVGCGPGAAVRRADRLCQQHGFIKAEVGRHQCGRRRTLSVTARIPPG